MPKLHRQAKVAELLHVSRSAVAQYVKRHKRNPELCVEVDGIRFLTAKGLSQWKAERQQRAEALQWR